MLYKGVDLRLGRRYQRLVKEHANLTKTLAVDLHALSTESKSGVTSTQAALIMLRSAKFAKRLKFLCKGLTTCMKKIR